MKRKIRWKIDTGVVGSEKEGEFEVDLSASYDEIEEMAKAEAFSEVSWEWWEEKMTKKITNDLLLKEWAEKLNGREYGQELAREEENKLREQGLVAVFGASDDLCEFRGAIYDEAGCYEGGTIYLNRDGILQSCDGSGNSQRSIVAYWCDHEYPWSYSTDIPHESFDIFECGEKYCRGIIFDIKVLDMAAEEQEESKLKK